MALRLQLLQDRFLVQDLWLSRAVARHLGEKFFLRALELLVLIPLLSEEKLICTATNIT